MSVRSGHHQCRPLLWLPERPNCLSSRHFVRFPNSRDPVAATAWLAANPQVMYRSLHQALTTGSVPLSISGTTPAFLSRRKRGGRFDDLRDKLKTDGPIEGEESHEGANNTLQAAANRVCHRCR